MTLRRERDGEKRVGSRFKRKAPFLLSNLLRDKKSSSLFPQDMLRERRGVIGHHSLCQSRSSYRGADQLSGFTLLHNTSLLLLRSWSSSSVSSRTFPLWSSGKFSLYPAVFWSSFYQVCCSLRGNDFRVLPVVVNMCPINPHLHFTQTQQKLTQFCSGPMPGCSGSAPGSAQDSLSLGIALREILLWLLFCTAVLSLFVMYLFCLED